MLERSLISLCAKSLQLGRYWDIIERFEKYQENGLPDKEILETWSNGIVDKTKSKTTPSQKLVIFDNYICETNQNDIIKFFFIVGRHKNLYCYLSSKVQTP